MNTFPSTPNERERKRTNQSPAFEHNFPGQFYLLILDFRIDTKLNPFKTSLVKFLFKKCKSVRDQSVAWGWGGGGGCSEIK